MYMSNLSIKIKPKTMDKLLRLYHMDCGRRQWDVYVRQFIDDAVDKRLAIVEPQHLMTSYPDPRK